jgi:hypothetical protein
MSGDNGFVRHWRRQSRGCGHAPGKSCPVRRGHNPPRGRRRRKSQLSGVAVLVCWLLFPSMPAGAHAAASDLPDWFDGNRVQAHTRLAPRIWRDEPEFEHGNAILADLGAKALVRHVKTGDEDPWWPSAVPTGPDDEPVLGDRANLIQPMVDDAHARGLRMIAYYWHMSDARIEALHPEWRCLDHRGDPITSKRGNHLDITSPYRRIVARRLVELADMGVDGFYFDHLHLPLQGCWGSNLELEFERETGLQAPPRVDQRDPIFRAWLGFKAAKVQETFAFWKTMVKREHPDVVFVISTTTLPALTRREMPTGLARISDSAKNEFRLALNKSLQHAVFEDGSLARPERDVSQGVGFAVLRDSADGRPPHVWAPGFPNTSHALGFAGALVTYGAVANMDVDEPNFFAPDPVAGSTPMPAIRAALALGAKVSPWLAHTRPLRFAAVHFPEAARNARGGDFRAAWEDVLWPMVGACGVLSRDGLPVGTVDDRQLAGGELDGYRLLVLPVPDELTRRQKAAVAAFEEAGGVVVANDPAWGWSDPATNAAARQRFRDAIEPFVEDSPVTVDGGPDRVHAVAYAPAQGIRARAGVRRLVVAVTNDFSWVQQHRLEKPLRPSDVNPPAPPASGVEVRWARRAALLPAPGPGVPLRVFEAVSGRSLRPTATRRGYRVRLPDIQHLALLVIDFPSDPNWRSSSQRRRSTSTGPARSSPASSSSPLRRIERTPQRGFSRFAGHGLARVPGS